MTDRIVLAHEPPFALGPAEVRPATRTIIAHGTEIVVEPRVMQVLVALAQASGEVLTRDDLTRRCWDGRVVGEDAINRVVSRLRRLADETGGAFTIETITRIGYRLTPHGNPAATPDATASVSAAPAARPTRRALVAAGAAGAVAVAGGGLWYALRRPSLPSEARAAMERGEIASSQTTPDQNAVAVAAFRSATELAPDAAETWGRLALSYRQQLAVSGVRDADEAVQIESRAHAAIARALALDPGNADALVAQATLIPFYRYWLQLERGCRPLVARFPQHGQLNLIYGIALSDVGRFADALAHFRVALAALPEWPQVHMRVMTTLWSIGQLDQADTEMDRAFAMWPRHYSVWFSRLRLLAYTGRGQDALAMIADRDTRPTGIPEWNFAMTEAEIRAIMTRAPADIARAAGLMFDSARRAVGFAANAAIFNIVVGRIDDAFLLLGAFFFDRGFAPGPQRYSEEQGMYDAHRERETSFLFSRDTAALRADPRFPGLVRAAGFTDYWRRSGTRPDQMPAP